MADIAINPVVRRVQFTGNTGLGPFAFTFNILQNTDIIVYKNTTLLTLTTDYTVTINANGTGSVTLTGSGSGTALITTDNLTIIGGRELSRTTDFVTAGDLLASSLNEQLDSNVIMSQQLDERFSRTISVSPGDADKTLTLPTVDDRKDKILKFDTEGNVEAAAASTVFANTVVGANFVNDVFTGTGAQTVFTLSTAPGSKNNCQIYIDGVYQEKSTFSINASTLTFTEAPPLNASIEVIIGNALDSFASDANAVNYDQGGTGFVSRTVESKLQEFVSVKDFGAVGDGVVDDTAALNAAAADLSSGQVLFIPEGTYLYNPTSAPLTFSTNNIAIWGKGTIKASVSQDKTVVLLSGNYITWDGPSVEGEGTVYSSYTPSTEDNRYALLRVTGDDVDIRSALINTPYLIGIHANACDNLTIGDGVDVLGGPIAAIVSTYFQGIRIYNCTNYRVQNPHIGANTAGGKPEEALFATDGENGFIQVNVSASWDHGVYCIDVDGLIVDGCTTVTNAGGIACSPPEYQNDKVTPTKLTNNNVRAAVGATGTVGFFIRDMHNAVIQGNFVEGFPQSYQIIPVQYDDANNNIEGIVFADNIARDWTEYGLLLAGGGLSLGKLQYIKISNFDSLPKRATQAAASTHIQSSLSAGITNSLIIDSCTLGSNGSHYPENGILLANVDNAIVTNNIIRDVTTKGIDLNNCDYVKITSNDLSDAGTTGIDIRGACSNGNVANNNIVDGALHTLAYGIDGNDNTAGFTFANNRIKGAGTVAIRRCQQASHTNTFFGNKSGDDALTGTVTLAAAITTTVTNDNVNQGQGYTSYVRLTPINQDAATLVSGANSPFVGAGDHTAGTSFKVRQTGAASGTEQFFYEIVQ